ncbi:hypothetical protein D3C74_440710 [compost metagenome]
MTPVIGITKYKIPLGSLVAGKVDSLISTVNCQPLMTRYRPKAKMQTEMSLSSI